MNPILKSAAVIAFLDIIEAVQENKETVNKQEIGNRMIDILMRAFPEYSKKDIEIAVWTQLGPLDELSPKAVKVKSESTFQDYKKSSKYPGRHRKVEN